MIVWIMTEVLWLLSFTGVEFTFQALLYWITFTYYFNIARISVIMVFKWIGVSLDSKKDYETESGSDMLNTTKQLVSKK